MRVVVMLCWGIISRSTREITFCTQTANRGLCFVAQVKIEMFAAGSSVAHVVFNATNSDKMDWMSRDRLLTSSWSDITEYMALKPVTISVVGRYEYT